MDAIILAGLVIVVIVVGIVALSAVVGGAVIATGINEIRENIP